jgi:hypothetical protein
VGEIHLNLTIKEENNLLFKRCIRKLLDATFIVGDKDTKLYAYISRESNRQDISDYLRMIGFDVLVDLNVRIAMLRPHESDEEAVGLKRANIVTFTTEQYHLLLVLWEVYLENLGYHEENVIPRGDLIDKITDFEVDMDSRRLNGAMELFRRYNLIDFDPKDKSEEAIITLYPSLQFGWDLAQFQTVSAQYIREGDAEEDDEETESGDIVEDFIIAEED